MHRRAVRKCWMWSRDKTYHHRAQSSLDRWKTLPMLLFWIIPVPETEIYLTTRKETLFYSGQNKTHYSTGLIWVFLHVGHYALVKFKFSVFYHWSFLLFFHHGNILAPLLSIQLRFQISNFRLQMYWWLCSTHAWDVVCVLYTGRSSSADMYACFLGNYTAMVIFSSNSDSVRREVEGSEARKRAGVAAGGKLWQDSRCG